jgi:cell division septum initiation protein DivIVA
MKDRVKVMFNGTHPEGATSEHALINPNGQGVPSTQALQVLTMAQRTAEEHLARAQHEADKIRTEAIAAAEEIGREAQMHAHNVRREAEQVLLDARAAAEQTARDAQMRAEEAQRSAAKVVLEARGEAGRITADAQANADQLRLAAQQRYDDVVGSLGARREALQQQIEALEQFDREYRARLTGFMQAQLRALWVDQPQVTGELPHEEPAVVAEVVEDAEPAQDEDVAAEDDDEDRTGRHAHASREE